MSNNPDYIENKTKGKKAKTLCVSCQHDTWHEVLTSIDTAGADNDPDSAISWSDDYQIIRCRGCETISFRHLHWFSEHADPWDDDSGTTERLYPKRDRLTHKAKLYLHLPTSLHQIYSETISAYNNECYTLAAVGLRVIVEGICLDKEVSGASLEKKISSLQEKGILTQSQTDWLDEHRLLGNEAVHELVCPRRQDVIVAIDILEHVLEGLYELPVKGSSLKASRGKSKKK